MIVAPLCDSHKELRFEALEFFIKIGLIAIFVMGHKIFLSLIAFCVSFINVLFIFNFPAFLYILEEIISMSNFNFKIMHISRNYHNHSSGKEMGTDF